MARPSAQTSKKVMATECGGVFTGYPSFSYTDNGVLVSNSGGSGTSGGNDFVGGSSSS